MTHVTSATPEIGQNPLVRPPAPDRPAAPAAPEEGRTMTETEPRFKAGDEAAVTERVTCNEYVAYTIVTILEVTPSGRIIAAKPKPSGDPEVMVFRPNGRQLGHGDNRWAPTIGLLTGEIRDEVRREDLKRQFLYGSWRMQVDRLTLAELEQVAAIFAKAVKRSEDRKVTEGSGR